MVVFGYTRVLRDVLQQRIVGLLISSVLQMLPKFLTLTLFVQAFLVVWDGIFNNQGVRWELDQFIERKVCALTWSMATMGQLKTPSTGSGPRPTSPN